MFRKEEVVANGSDQRSQAGRGAGVRKKQPGTEFCSLSSFRDKGDPVRLSETLPPDRYMKDIDFILKVLRGNKCQCLALSLSYSVRKF